MVDVVKRAIIIRPYNDIFTNTGFLTSLLIWDKVVFVAAFFLLIFRKNNNAWKR
jgi:hypothetical protein